MQQKKTNILISVPFEFKDKFLNLLNNVNAMNFNSIPVIKIEWTHDDVVEYAAIPKEKKK
jgi:hypothetical protein